MRGDPAAAGWELTGVPYTSMRVGGGIADAIGVLRGLGLAERLAETGVVDAGDLQLVPVDGIRGPSALLNEPALAALVVASRDRVKASLTAGRKPLLVGGDCPVLLGPLAAIRDRGERPGLCMVDGHEDAWPPVRSPTGEASDSEVAIALGDVDHLPDPIAGLVPLVEASAVALLGPRDRAELDAASLDSLRDRVGVFASAGEVPNAKAAKALARGALRTVEADGFWLHIDLDALASAEFAAVDYPQPGGLGWDELSSIAAPIAADRRCRGASVVIYNPALDPERDDARKVISFARALAAVS